MTELPKSPSVLILGGGAVGTFVAAKLAAGGASVAILNRGEAYCRAVNGNGIAFKEDGKPVRSHATAFSTVSSLFEKEVPFSLAIFCVKSFSTKPLAEALAPYSQRIGEWLTLQNGVGNEEILLNFFPREKITAGSLTIACSMEEAGLARAENKGGIALASVSGAPVPFDTVISPLQAADFTIKLCPDWKAMKWSKLFLNILLNATCAILEMPPSEIVADQMSFHIERKLALEALAVIEAQGLSAVSLPGQPVSLYAWGVKHLPEKLLQLAFARKAASGRGNKLPSLQLDWMKGKTETEAPFLYGSLVEKGRELNVRIPVLRTVVALLQERERDARNLDKFKRSPEALHEAILSGASPRKKA